MTARKDGQSCSGSSMEELAAVNRRTEDRYLPGARNAVLQDTVTSPVMREVMGSNPIVPPWARSSTEEHLRYRFRFLSALSYAPTRKS